MGRLNQKTITNKIAECLNTVRTMKPLVHNITNYVVMNSTANALLAIGAAPVMSHAESELEEMINIANALVINIGTLDDVWINSMKKAVNLAKHTNKPVVLDPVGAGATKLRTNTVIELLKKGKITVLKGNYGEISAVLGKEGKTRGVDTLEFSPTTAKKIVKKVSKKYGIISVITGPTDFISNGKVIIELNNGVSLLEKITGTGCMLASLIGAFVSVCDALYGTTAAVATMNIASEKAYEEAKLPGTFSVKLMDYLYKINERDIQERLHIKIITG